MVACRCAPNFSRQGTLEQGLGNLLKKAISGEGMQLMKMEGKDRVYVADSGKMITLLRLAGDSDTRPWKNLTTTTHWMGWTRSSW
jgi:uncharacterized protein (AIM24 family)